MDVVTVGRRVSSSAISSRFVVSIVVIYLCIGTADWIRKVLSSVIKMYLKFSVRLRMTVSSSISGGKHGDNWEKEFVTKKFATTIVIPISKIPNFCNSASSPKIIMHVDAVLSLIYNRIRPGNILSSLIFSEGLVYLSVISTSIVSRTTPTRKFFNLIKTTITNIISKWNNCS